MPCFRFGVLPRAAALAVLLAGPVLPTAVAGERAPATEWLVQLTPEQHRQMREEPLAPRIQHPCGPNVHAQTDTAISSRKPPQSAVLISVAVVCG